MTPLAALLLTDGRPGHFRRAEGIIAAIARVRRVSTTYMDARRRLWMPGRLLAPIVQARAARAGILKVAYGIDAADLPRSDLVVSSGGNTLAANVCAARLLGVPNIVYGGIRQFRPQDFSLVLTSYGDHASRPRHKMTPLMPVPDDPDAFELTCVETSGPVRPPKVAGLLIGGDAGTFRYVPSDWDRLFTFVADMHTQCGTRWLIANSRRTPAQVSDALSERARQPGAPIEAFIDVRSSGPGTLRRLFEDSQVVVCTDDSTSMITEAIWLRRPVLGVAPKNCSFAERESWYRRHLVANGWTSSLPIAELSPKRMLDALAGIQPLTGNPVEALAATIRDSLPELFRAA
jgi:mitochondrial fission protein ELM1